MTLDYIDHYKNNMTLVFLDFVILLERESIFVNLTSILILTITWLPHPA